MTNTRETSLACMPSPEFSSPLTDKGTPPIPNGRKGCRLTAPTYISRLIPAKGTRRFGKAEISRLIRQGNPQILPIDNEGASLPRREICQPIFKRAPPPPAKGASPREICQPIFKREPPPPAKGPAPTPPGTLRLIETEFYMAGGSPRQSTATCLSPVWPLPLWRSWLWLIGRRLVSQHAS